MNYAHRNKRSSEEEEEEEADQEDDLLKVRQRRLRRQTQEKEQLIDDDDDNNTEHRDNYHEKMDNHQEDRLAGECLLGKLIEKSVIIHKDENGFGLRFKGQCPIYVEHVHENGAAWRAGVRPLDTINKVNGIPVNQLSHKDIILMFKSCARFVAITLLSQAPPPLEELNEQNGQKGYLYSRQASTYSHRSCISSLTSYDGRDENVGGRRVQAADRTGSCCRTASARNLNNNNNNNSNRLTIPTSRRAGGFSSGETQSNKSALSSCTQLALMNMEKINQLSANNHRKQFGAKIERRDSFDVELKTSGDKRMAVCVFCRNSVKTTTTNNTRALDTTCSQCQLGGYNSLDGAAKRPQPGGANRLDSQQASDEDQKSNPNETTNNHNGKQQNLNSIEKLQSTSNASMRDPNSRHAYKLAQSASTNSLPSEGPNKLLAVAKVHLANSDNLNQDMDSKRAPTKLIINKRVEIIREFIDTEKTHTERLRCLDELFYRPLRVGGLMSPEQLRMVFSCHRTLYKIHRQIYRILLSTNYGHLYGSEPLIGSALLEIFEGKFRRRLERAAISFCSAQATNIELLNKLTRRDTKVGEFLAHVTSQQMVGRLGIKDLLASCFQRLTKYPLLLENLLKATPEAPHEDDDDSDDHFRSTSDDNQNLATTNRLAKLRASHSNDVDYYDEDFDENNLDGQGEDDDDEEGRLRQVAEENARRLNSKRMLAISLAEERDFIDRALQQSRQILVKVNEAIRVAVSRQKLKEIWKRTDKYPGVPLIDITNQQVVHEGLLTLRLSKRSFDVYVLLLNDYLIILTREGQDKYRLKFFTPEGKSSSSSSSTTTLAAPGGPAGTAGSGTIGGVTSSGGPQYHQSVYSPVFVIDEHLTTRDAATDENGFYLLCKRKDDSRIYEFASRSPAERMKWRDSIQWTIDRQISRNNSFRRASCDSTTAIKSNSQDGSTTVNRPKEDLTESDQTTANDSLSASEQMCSSNSSRDRDTCLNTSRLTSPSKSNRPNNEPTKFVGTISYVVEDEIVLPSEMELSKIQVDQAIQVNVFDTTSTSSAEKATAAVPMV